MPRIRLTKSAVDALPAPRSDLVYWDVACPGFGVKVTPKGRKVFVVLYRTAGARSKLPSLRNASRRTVPRLRYPDFFGVRLEGLGLAGAFTRSASEM